MVSGVDSMVSGVDSSVSGVDSSVSCVDSIVPGVDSSSSWSITHSFHSSNMSIPSSFKSAASKSSLVGKGKSCKYAYLSSQFSTSYQESPSILSRTHNWKAILSSQYSCSVSLNGISLP